MVVPDWFFNVPIAWDAQGRVDVNSGSFNNVNAGNPRLYAEDVVLTNTGSPVTSINLSWDSGNTGNGLAAFFAVSGIAPLILPYNLTLTPLMTTQYAGAAVAFSITASGTAPLTYQWQKNGLPVNGATNSIFALSNLSTNDAAIYACAVANLGGVSLSASAMLTVLPLPVIGVAMSGGLPALTWSNTAVLLEATNLAGPWFTNQTATSPYQIVPNGTQAFFRLLLPSPSP
jgi:hypothetical protein